MGEREQFKSTEEKSSSVPKRETFSLYSISSGCPLDQWTHHVFSLPQSCAPLMAGAFCSTFQEPDLTATAPAALVWHPAACYLL